MSDYESNDDDVLLSEEIWGYLSMPEFDKAEIKNDWMDDSCEPI